MLLKKNSILIFFLKKSFPFFGGVPTILDEDGKEKEGVEVDQGYLVKLRLILVFICNKKKLFL